MPVYLKDIIYDSGRSSSVSSLEFAEDKNLLHLVGSVVDLEHTRISIVLLDRIIVDETVPSMNLYRSRADALAHLRSKQLCHGCFFNASRPLFLERSRVAAHLARRFDFSGHLGEPECDRLMAC